MKKLIIATVILAVVAGGAYILWHPQSSVAAEAKKAAPEVAPATKDTTPVIAEGKVVPLEDASLSMATGGTVAQLLVAEGDQVQPGQALLRLTNSRQQAAVSQAQAGLDAARARLAEVQQGPRPQEIAAAQAAVDVAQAQLDRLLEAARPEDIAAGEASVASAQAALQKVREGPREEELVAARADMANAEAALKLAQAEYDRLGWRDDRPALGVSLELEQATNTYTAAKGRYEALAKGASEADVAAAQAGIRQAQAELERVKVPARNSDIAAAQAEVRRAQAQLDLLQAGARPEQIAAAQADVAAAQAALEQAQAALQETELRAPFGGTVASLTVKAGETVAAGTAVLHLADLSAWQIETQDLTEIEVVQVQPGDAVTITFDALDGVELPGKVVRINALGENKQGDITYTALVQPEGYNPQLRWNMTAVTSIQPSEP